MDPWLISTPPEHKKIPWENIENQVVVNFPRLRFDVGGIVAYQMDGFRIGLDYEGGHPAYACTRAPFLAIPFRVPLPIKTLIGFDLALGMNVPVMSMGGGSRPPVEMDLALTLHVDTVVHALGTMHPLAMFTRPADPTGDSVQ